MAQLQNHTFNKASDQDWVAFQATTGQRYLILGDVPADSRADLVLIPYRSCGAVPDPGQNYSFSARCASGVPGPSDRAGVSEADEPHSLHRWHGRELLDFRSYALQENAESGALILVAGRIREDDPLQSRIYAVTDAVYRLFLAHGYTADRVFYLAPDFRTGVDAAASADNLRAAITTWARDKVGPNRPLTLFMMDHGARERFYLDRPRSESVSPTELDAWLAELETAWPGLLVNVMLEACHSGSFMEPARGYQPAGPGGDCVHRRREHGVCVGFRCDLL